MKLQVTTVESGFCNIAATTYAGNCYTDEPGEGENCVWEFEAAEGSHLVNDDGVVWLNEPGKRPVIISGNRHGLRRLEHLGIDGDKPFPAVKIL